MLPQIHKNNLGKPNVLLEGLIRVTESSLRSSSNEPTPTCFPSSRVSSMLLSCGTQSKGMGAFSLWCCVLVLTYSCWSLMPILGTLIHLVNLDIQSSGPDFAFAGHQRCSNQNQERLSIFI